MPRASTCRARPRSSSRVRASTSGPEASTFDAATSASATSARNCARSRRRSARQSRPRCPRAARRASRTRSRRARARRRPAGSTFSLISFTVTVTDCFDSSASSKLDLLRLARGHADEALLDLLDDGAAAELDDVVARVSPFGRDEVDDDGVVGSDGTPFDRHELATVRAQRVELLLDELLRHFRLDRADLERRPVGELRLRLHRERRGELPVLARPTRGARSRTRAARRDARACCAAAFQNQPPMWLSIASLMQALAADALDEELPRHLALAEAGDLRRSWRDRTLRARSRGARRATAPAPSGGRDFQGAPRPGPALGHSSKPLVGSAECACTCSADTHSRRSTSRTG